MIDMATDTENMSFEDALALLQKLIKELEEGNLPLDKALKTFQEAVAVSRVCNKKLEMAQEEVKKIVVNEEDSDYKLEDFECQ